MFTLTTVAVTVVTSVFTPGLCAVAAGPAEQLVTDPADVDAPPPEAANAPDLDVVDAVFHELFESSDEECWRWW